MAIDSPSRFRERWFRQHILLSLPVGGKMAEQKRASILEALLVAASPAQDENAAQKVERPIAITFNCTTVNVFYNTKPQLLPEEG